MNERHHNAPISPSTILLQQESEASENQFGTLFANLLEAEARK